jgi:hypothetical protein
MASKISSDFYSSEENADIVTRDVDVVKTLIIPSYLYVFNETSGATSENLKVWLTEHILVQSLNHTTTSLRDIKRSSFRKDKRVLSKFSQHLQLELQYQYLPHSSEVVRLNGRLNSVYRPHPRVYL